MIESELMEISALCLRFLAWKFCGALQVYITTTIIIIIIIIIITYRLSTC